MHSKHIVLTLCKETHESTLCAALQATLDNVIITGFKALDPGNLPIYLSDCVAFLFKDEIALVCPVINFYYSLVCELDWCINVCFVLL